MHGEKRRLLALADGEPTVGVELTDIAGVEPAVAQGLGGLATVLGRYDEADTYFAQSAALCDRMVAKFFAAQTDAIEGAHVSRREGGNDR